VSAETYTLNLCDEKADDTRTAAILRHATERSLVIMDEIGRGTTLHSGLSIAYATLDHILSKIRCRTMFATHYHEVADMLAVGKGVRDGVEFWCTDVDELVSAAQDPGTGSKLIEQDGAFSYQYRLHRGINHNSHAIVSLHLIDRCEEGVPSDHGRKRRVSQACRITSLRRRRAPWLRWTRD
jgi:DNA mismatch repair ATPase MutS